jgi:inorganic pyrophosphatase
MADNPAAHGRRVQAVTETPRGSRNKYKMDEHSGQINLSKVMPEGMVFPYDFGFFLETCGEDGDPLDVLILTDEPTFPGCQIDCRVVARYWLSSVMKGRKNTETIESSRLQKLRFPMPASKN